MVGESTREIIIGIYIWQSGFKTSTSRGFQWVQNYLGTGKSHLIGSEFILNTTPRKLLVTPTTTP